MILSEVKAQLQHMEEVVFVRANGERVPAHFHVSEVGKITRHFIDCGGTIRNEEVVNFQLWSSNDYHHRLGAKKLLQIIQLSEEKLGIGDFEIEVEYQGDTIGKYGLAVQDGVFVLTNTSTACLANESCRVPEMEIEAVQPAFDLNVQNNCAPGSGCC